MAQETPDRPGERSVLVIASIASFITPFMVSSVHIALPAIGRAFSMTAIALGWVATSYILAAAIFLVPFGKAADIYGRKRILILGTAIYTVASLLCALSTSTPMLIAMRIVQGIGAAMIFGTSIAILTSVYRPGRRGRALGITTAATYLGLSLGPVFGGLLTEHLGWRSIFLVPVPLGLLEIILILLKLEGEWREARGERFDVPGAVIYGAALASLMYGFSRLPTPVGVWLVCAAALGIAAFVAWELRSSSPLLHMDLFARNRVFAFSNFAALINYSASFAVTFLMSLYLQYLRALTPEEAGFVLVSQPIMMAAFSPLAGRLSDRVESRIVASIGMAVTAAALVFFVFVRGGSPLLAVIADLMLLGFGLALFSSPNVNAIMSSVEPRLYGVASATLATMRMTGQMLSMGIAMLIFAVRIGTVRIAPEYYGPFLTSFRIAFIIFSALSVLGVFASLARGNVRTVAGAESSAS
jgi:EmrB/QacA subfamily drug resistance transporter